MGKRRGRNEVVNIENFGNTAVFDGNPSKYLSINPSVDFDFGTSDFSIDSWFYIKDSTAGNIFGTAGGGYSDNSLSIYINVNIAKSIRVLISNGVNWSLDLYASNAFEFNKWNHILLSRINQESTLKINLTTVATNNTTGAVLSSAGKNLRIGSTLNGNISNLRIFKNKAISINTLPLTSEDYADDVNRTFFMIGATDINSPAKAITNNGSVQVQNIPIIYP